MLAVVFGVERFHTYIYGWSFMIKSDHKLLESISRKNSSRHACMAPMHECYPCRDMTSQSLTQARKWSYQTHSLNSVPGQARASIGYHYPSCLHNARLQGSFPASHHQWSINVSSCWPHHYWLAQGHQGSPSIPSAHTGNTERLSQLRML